MADESNKRLLTAQWVMDVNLKWIATAEVKTGVVVTLSVAMLGGLAAAYNAAAVRSGITILCSLTASAFLLIAVGCAAATVLPRLKGPNASLLFFGRVAELSAADYAEKFRVATDQELLTDWVEQIHRNAEIAKQKHGWVRLATIWGFLAAMPWAAAVALLIK